MYLVLHLPGVSGTEHTEKKVSDIKIVDGKVNDKSTSVLRNTRC